MASNPPKSQWTNHVHRAEDAGKRLARRVAGHEDCRRERNTRGTDKSVCALIIREKARPVLGQTCIESAGSPTAAKSRSTGERS